MGLVLLIVVLLILFGGVGVGYQGNNAGYGIGGLGGLLLLILLIMLFLGHVGW